MDRDARPGTIRTVEDVLKWLSEDGTELQLGHEGAKLVAQALPRCKSLQRLSLTSCNIGPEGAKALAGLLPQCTALTSLELGENDIGPEGVKALAAVLPQCTALTTLGLSANSIGMEGAKALAHVLPRCTALAELRLASNDIGADGSKAIAPFLAQCKALRLLNIDGNKIGAAGSQAIAEVLPGLEAFEVLSLSDNKIGPEGAKAIAAAVPKCKNLLTLWLNSNDLSVEGTKVIAAVLPKCKALQELSLNGNYAAAEGATSIAATLPECKSLQILWFLDDGIGAEGARSLAGAIPKCFALQHVSVDVIDVSADPSPVYTAVPAELRRDFQNVVRFLLDARGKLQWHRRAKLIVLGNAGVGKTTLLDALIQPLTPVFVPAMRQWLWLQGRYLKVYDVDPSSVSVPVQSHDLENATVSRTKTVVHISSPATALDVSVPLPNHDIALAWYDYVRFHAKRTETLGIHTRSWEILSAVNSIPPTLLTVLDFAGQVEYYDSHIMFLSSRAIYLLLWSLKDPSDVAEGRLVFWSDSLRRHVVNSENVRANVVPVPPILLVGTNLDHPPLAQATLSGVRARQARAQAVAANIMGNTSSTPLPYHEVDGRAPNGRGMQDLRTQLEDTVRQWPLLDQRIPSSYARVLDVIRAQAIARNPPVLDLETLHEVCLSSTGLRDLGVGTLCTALELFDAWGDCIYYGKDRRADVRVSGVHTDAEITRTTPESNGAAIPFLQRRTEGFGDVANATVVLRPAWLMETVYGPATLTAKKAGGIIAKRQIDDSAYPDKLWPDWLPETRQRAMAVLVEFRLCTQLRPPHVNAGDWFLPGALPENPSPELPPLSAQPVTGEFDIVRDLEWEFLTSSVFGALLIRLQTMEEVFVLHSWRLGAFIKARPTKNNSAASTVVRIDVHPQQPKMRLWARGVSPINTFTVVLRAALAIAQNNHPRPLKVSQTIRCTVPGCHAEIDVVTHFAAGPCRFHPSDVIGAVNRSLFLRCKRVPRQANDVGRALAGLVEEISVSLPKTRRISGASQNLVQKSLDFKSLDQSNAVGTICRLLVAPMVAKASWDTILVDMRFEDSESTTAASELSDRLISYGYRIYSWNLAGNDPQPTDFTRSAIFVGDEESRPGIELGLTRVLTGSDQFAIANQVIVIWVNPSAKLLTSSIGVKSLAWKLPLNESMPVLITSIAAVFQKLGARPRVERLTRCVSVVVLGFAGVGKTTLTHALFPLQRFLKFSNDSVLDDSAYFVLQDKRLLQYNDEESYRADEDSVRPMVLYVIGATTLITTESTKIKLFVKQSPRPLLTLTFEHVTDLNEWARRLTHAQTGVSTEGIDQVTVRAQDGRTDQNHSTPAPAAMPPSSQLAYKMDTISNIDSADMSTMSHVASPSEQKAGSLDEVANNNNPLDDMADSAEQALKQHTEPKSSSLRSEIVRITEYFPPSRNEADSVVDSVMDSMDITVWDFAGQEKYYTSHHHYLPGFAIYVLVIDLTKSMISQLSAQMTFWLSTLFARKRIWQTDKPPNLLIVATHADAYHKSILKINGRNRWSKKVFRMLHQVIQSIPRPSGIELDQLVGLSTCYFVECAPPNYENVGLVRNALLKMCQTIVTYREEAVSELAKCMAATVEDLRNLRLGRSVWSRQEIKYAFLTYVEKGHGLKFREEAATTFDSLLNILFDWGQILLFPTAPDVVVLDAKEFSKNPLAALVNLDERERSLKNRPGFVPASKVVSTLESLPDAGTVLDTLFALRVCFRIVTKEGIFYVFPEFLPIDEPVRSANGALWVQPCPSKMREAVIVACFDILPRELVAALIAQFHESADIDSLFHSGAIFKRDEYAIRIQARLASVEPIQPQQENAAPAALVVPLELKRELVFSLREPADAKTPTSGMNALQQMVRWMQNYLKMEYPDLRPVELVPVSNYSRMAVPNTTVASATPPPTAEHDVRANAGDVLVVARSSDSGSAVESRPEEKRDRNGDDKNVGIGSQRTVNSHTLEQRRQRHDKIIEHSTNGSAYFLVIFISIVRVRALCDSMSVTAMAYLHNAVARTLIELDPNGQYLIRALSTTTGAIVLVPDDPQISANLTEYIYERIYSPVAMTMVSSRLDLCVGVSYGLLRIEVNAVGVQKFIVSHCLGTAAQTCLATENPGLLFHSSYIRRFRNSPQWLQQPSMTLYQVTGFDQLDTLMCYSNPAKVIRCDHPPIDEPPLGANSRSLSNRHVFLVAIELDPLRADQSEELRLECVEFLQQVHELTRCKVGGTTHAIYPERGTGIVLAVDNFNPDLVHKLSSELEDKMQFYKRLCDVKAGLHIGSVYCLDNVNGLATLTSGALFEAEVVARDAKVICRTGTVIVGDQVLECPGKAKNYEKIKRLDLTQHGFGKRGFTLMRYARRRGFLSKLRGNCFGATGCGLGVLIVVIIIGLGMFAATLFPPFAASSECLGVSCDEPLMISNQETPTQYLVWTWRQTRYDIFLSFRGSERYDLAPTAGTVAEADTMRVSVIQPAYEQLKTDYKVFYDDTALADAMSRGPGATLNDLVQGLLSTRGGGVVVAVVTKSYLARTWPLIELAVAAKLHLAKQLCLVILLLNVEPQEIAQHGFLQQHCPDIGLIPMQKVLVGLERSDAAGLRDFIVREARSYRGIDVTGESKRESYNDLLIRIADRFNVERDVERLAAALDVRRQPHEELMSVLNRTKDLSEDNVAPLRHALEKYFKTSPYSDLIDVVHKYENKWLASWTTADAATNFNIDALLQDAKAHLRRQGGPSEL